MTATQNKRKSFIRFIMYPLRSSIKKIRFDSIQHSKSCKLPYISSLLLTSLLYISALLSLIKLGYALCRFVFEFDNNQMGDNVIVTYLSFKVKKKKKRFVSGFKPKKIRIGRSEIFFLGGNFFYIHIPLYSFLKRISRSRI